MLALEVEVLLVGPDHLDDVDPFLGVIVAVAVLTGIDAEHVELAFVPADHDVEPEAAFADVIGGDHLLRRHHRIEDQRMHGAEHGDAPGAAEEASGPGDGFQRRALIVGVAAIPLPAADRQHEVDTGLVRHLRQALAVRPAARPTLRHQGHGAAGRAVGAEQADLQLVVGVHGAARLRAMLAGRARGMTFFFSPPPCGEGQGWGSESFIRASKLSHHLSLPHPNPPHEGEGKTLWLIERGAHPRHHLGRRMGERRDRCLDLLAGQRIDLEADLGGVAR